MPVTVRTLESLIRLATAHAKCRLSDKVEEKDCDIAVNLMKFTLFADEDEV
jgi:DNA replication licensing factor MCM3